MYGRCRLDEGAQRVKCCLLYTSGKEQEMEKVNVQCAPADVFQKITRDIAFVKVSLLAEEE